MTRQMTRRLAALTLAVCVSGGVLSAKTALADSEKKRTISITATKDGKETRIQEDADGVTVSYPNENGEKIEAKARSVAELREKFPAAYKVYEQYVGDGVTKGVFALNPPVPTTQPGGFSERRERVEKELREKIQSMRPGERFFPEDLGIRSRKAAEDALREAREALEKAEGLAAVTREKLASALAKAQDALENNRLELRRFAPGFAPDQPGPDRPRSLPAPLPPGDPGKADIKPPTDLKPRLGIIAVEADPVLVEQLGDGVVVSQVMPDSKASRMDVQLYDLIQSINGQKVSDAYSLRAAVNSAEGKLKLSVVRHGKTVELEEK